MTVKRISVFAPVGTLDHQTGIMNAVRCFAAAGFSVDVLTVRNRRYPAPCFESDSVRVQYMPWTFDAEREPRSIVTLLFAAWVLLRFWHRHDVIFAGGIRGLLAAYAYATFRRTRIVNYQTELYVGSKLDTPAARLFKSFERRAAQNSHITIEHDEERKQLLCSDLGIDAARILVVPNSPIGPARTHRSTLLHGRVSLPERTPLLLCPGTMGEAFETTKLVLAAQRLPRGWQCVIHSAQPRSENDPYLMGLRALDVGRRVSFSLQPIPYTHIDDLMGSATIGIALYSDSIGQNYSAVGLASGKLSHFLKVGVPVIVSPLPGLADFVRRYRVGEVLEEAEMLPELVERLVADADGYRDRALRCFDEHLSYDRAFAPVIDRVSTWFSGVRGLSGRA